MNEECGHVRKKRSGEFSNCLIVSNCLIPMTEECGHVRKRCSGEFSNCLIVSNCLIPMTEECAQVRKRCSGEFSNCLIVSNCLTTATVELGDNQGVPVDDHNEGRNDPSAEVVVAGESVDEPAC